MAEAAVFSLASKVLSTLASPAFTAAYKEGLSIWGAKDDLSKLQVTIGTIQAVLLDAEKKQMSDGVRNWIMRVKAVLYDADDLFDQVATQDMLIQQIQKGRHNLISKKVLTSCSKLNPTISRYSIAKEVKEIRKALAAISTDMAQFGFLICESEVPTSGIRTGQDPGSFVDTDLVIGREDDKKAVQEMLFNESNNVVHVPLVIAIVGIGGLGKTTLAQLVYNDDEVKRNFGNRWFACISDTSDEREILGKIFRSIQGEDHSSFSVGELQSGIRDSVKGKKFLLVLDDVWEDHRSRWHDRLSLLRSCAKGSRIIVTTRLQSVVDAVGASRDHNLEGLSEENAWCLFKSIAFAPDYENDPRRISLGNEILKRCKGVPLAIRSVGSLLSERNTISEWEAIERGGFPKTGNKYHDETMSVIKVSYDHLPSNLKHCFAYCSLFPKDYEFMKHELICLWTAQGYIGSNYEDTAFMHLLRRGFFQDMEKDDLGEVKSCKMHDMMHDLALYVAGEESIALSGTTSQNTSSFTRHVSLEDRERDVPLLNAKRLRSLLLMGINSLYSQATLNKLCRDFKMLRTLSLRGLGIKNLPPSIGELELMRYLDLSYNEIEELPDSLTNLVNLFALNLEGCQRLKVLPKKFRKLINLVYLNIEQCDKLMKMPIGIEDLTCLQYLSLYQVHEGIGLDVLAGFLQQLRGELLINFIDHIVDENECNWKLPVWIQKLEIRCYRGIRIPDWGTTNWIGRTNIHLAHLTLVGCMKVKHLPPLQLLPNLRRLELVGLRELEFVESEEDYLTSTPFYPRLETLKLIYLPTLKRWTKRRNITLEPQFPLLSELQITRCRGLDLASFPLCRHLRTLELCEVDEDSMERQLPSTLFCPSVSTPLNTIGIEDCKWLLSLEDETTASLYFLKIKNCSTLKRLQLATTKITLSIADCDEIASVEVADATELWRLEIKGCKALKNLTLGAPLDRLDTLKIEGCPELDLWNMEWEWDSLANLDLLTLNPMTPAENIPLFLRNRQALGQLQITD